MMDDGTVGAVEAEDAEATSEAAQGSPVSGRILAAVIVVAVAVMFLLGRAWLDIRAPRDTRRRRISKAKHRLPVESATMTA